MLIFSNWVSFLAFTAVFSSVIAFVYTLLFKWKVIEWFQVHLDSYFEDMLGIKLSLFNKMFSCSFCTIWWMSIVICLVLFFILGDIRFMLVPFVSTTISRHLI